MSVEYKIFTAKSLPYSNEEYAGELFETHATNEKKFYDLHLAIDWLKTHSADVFNGHRYACVKRMSGDNEYDCHWYEYHSNKYNDIPTPTKQMSECMTLDRILYKYKYRDVVWKEDVKKMAEEYEKRIESLEAQLRDKE